jgi:hypothetical protein
MTNTACPFSRSPSAALAAEAAMLNAAAIAYINNVLLVAFTDVDLRFG